MLYLKRAMSLSVSRLICCLYMETAFVRALPTHAYHYPSSRTTGVGRIPLADHYS